MMVVIMMMPLMMRLIVLMMLVVMLFMVVRFVRARHCCSCLAVDNAKAPLDAYRKNRLTALATERKLCFLDAPVSTLAGLHGTNAEVLPRHWCL